ncbi:pleckstrin homology domain-containing family G member 1-like isoform X2 [Plodia interpunctella]|uniref:pleckstrin homology domain-containing family G member 1-like isoform X2 n=1 Tax=Plodia interpunctella TaxID=58824 RepID=UPI002367DC69|nr:pleckstrin homology domain-containing family G member 1-like isoform X2 [Plodia interpunctella]
MTQEGLFGCPDDEFQSSSGNISDDDEIVLRKDDDITLRKNKVRDMIVRFEQTSLKNNFRASSESIEKTKDVYLGSVVNPIQAYFQHLNPVTRSQDRNSNLSVNSLLSNISENGYDSSSSGFVSESRKSTRNSLQPHRPAPPPPEPFNDSSSIESKSPAPAEVDYTERRFSFTTPNSSPVARRRSRPPPVLRRKSTAGSQGHVGETHWSYGVSQSDLEKLLRLKRSVPSDNEEDIKIEKVQSDEERRGSSSSSGSGSSGSDGSNRGAEYVINQDEDRADTLSADHSTDTLINEDDGEGQDNLSVTSSETSENSNIMDNVSIKSISSFDMVPYQKYDSITISSDEFGSEVCHAPSTEFLTVSAVNEWCVSRSAEPVLIPVESKKEKYRRRLTERVNELIHTENVYVERLKHVIVNYMPEAGRGELDVSMPPSLVKLKPLIFANIEDIFRFHSEEFLPALRDCEHDLRKLGQCFRQFEQRFNMYVMYSRNNKTATRLVYEYKDFFQRRQLDINDRLDLSSYLLEPIQRIPRYKLFLVDLVKTYTNYENERCETDSRISKLSVDSDETGGSNGESSDNEETPFESLKRAKTMIERILTAIDEIMALENIKDCPAELNLLQQGRLLRQNEFYAMDLARRKRQLMRVFLFDKLVLITVVFRKPRVECFIYKDHIPVDDLGITAKEEDHHKFTIWYKKRNLKSYKLETAETAVRETWVEEITTLLWEQAMQKKELLLQQRNKRISTISMKSQQSADGDRDDKYNSLRGVPGEVRRFGEKISRRTTWYYE